MWLFTFPPTTAVTVLLHKLRTSPCQPRRCSPRDPKHVLPKLGEPQTPKPEKKCNKKLHKKLVFQGASLTRTTEDVQTPEFDAPGRRRHPDQSRCSQRPLPVTSRRKQRKRSSGGPRSISGKSDVRRRRHRGGRDIVWEEGEYADDKDGGCEYQCVGSPATSGLWTSTWMTARQVSLLQHG